MSLIRFRGETIMKNLSKLFVILLSMAMLSACSEVRLSLDYSPTSTEEIESRIYVNDFTYHPKQGIEQDEIRETAMGRVLLTEPVGRFVSDAVRREFRQSGISLKSMALCYMDGEVTDFAMDSLGYSSDYMTDFRYILKKKDTHNVLYDTSYQVKFNTSKFVVAAVILNNINKAVSDNIKQLLVDPKFVKAAEEQCPKQ